MPKAKAWMGLLTAALLTLAGCSAQTKDATPGTPREPSGGTPGIMGTVTAVGNGSLTITSGFMGGGPGQGQRPEGTGAPPEGGEAPEGKPEDPPEMPEGMATPAPGSTFAPRPDGGEGGEPVTYSIDGDTRIVTVGEDNKETSAALSDLSVGVTVSVTPREGNETTADRIVIMIRAIAPAPAAGAK